MCVIHCMAIPFVLLLLPALSTFFTETMEHILVLGVVPLSMAGFLPTWLRHKNNRLMLLYVISIVLILFSQFALHTGHEDPDYGLMTLANWTRTVLTLTGALILAWVVFQNNRHTHYCTHPHHHQDKARPLPDHGDGIPN